MPMDTWELLDYVERIRQQAAEQRKRLPPEKGGPPQPPTDPDGEEEPF